MAGSTPMNPGEFRGLDAKDRAKIAENTSNPAILEVASKDRSALVRNAAAANPHTPQNALRRLSEARRGDTRGLVGANPATPPDVLGRLVKDESWMVRESAVGNRITPWIAVSRAHRGDLDSRVRMRAARTLLAITQNPVDTPLPPEPWLHYAPDCHLISIDGDRLHVLLPCDLEDLVGPTTGTVILPIRIDGSVSGGSDGRVYDLSDDGDVEAMYRVILTEVTLRGDLFSLVNAKALARIWDCLRIPKYVRETWEFRFPELVR